jgi:hypothetical protein
MIAEAEAEVGFVDLTDDELAAQIDGYADLPQSVKNEMAYGRRASWEMAQRLAAAAALDAAAEAAAEAQ